MPPRPIHVGDLPRIRQIAGVLGRQGFGRDLRKTAFGSFLPETDTEVEEHWTVRVRRTLVELGPTFVKLGQVLSVRPDIIPVALARELQALLDRVDPVEFGPIRKVLEDELGAPLEDLFECVDETALASASIAQVHRARLKDGTAVAVKVQRPGIEPIIQSDIRILYAIARILEGEIHLAGIYTLSDIVSEFEMALYQELDFLLEARNCERFRKSISTTHPDVFVPRTYPRFSTRRVLAMELCQGRPATTLTPEDPRVGRWARTLLDCTLKQVFQHGLFHGDPHPGNVFILEDGRLGYLDFGLVGNLTADNQRTLTNIFTSLVFKDPEGLTLAVYHAGGTQGRVDLKSFRKEVDRLMEKYYGASISTFADRANLLEIIEVASRYHIILPREFAVLGRAAALTYGLTQRLLPDVDIMTEVKPLAQELMTEQFNPTRVAAEVARTVIHAQSTLSHVPLQVNQLLADLEAGRLQVVFRSPDLESLREQVHNEGFRITLSICALAMVVAGAVLVGRCAGEAPGSQLVPILGGLSVVVSVFLWIYLVAHTHLKGRIQPRQALRSLVKMVLDMRRR